MLSVHNFRYNEYSRISNRWVSFVRRTRSGYFQGDYVFIVIKLYDLCLFAGFVGVYMAGHVLEVTKNWNLVFNQTIEVICVGWVIFMIFGTGKRIV